MNKKSFTTETWVGLFLIAGLLLIAGMVIYFGQIDNLLKPTYSFTVDFPNASGLLKGSDVYLSGATIGKVTSDPQPIADEQRVRVTMRINSDVKLRENAQFVIGSSGLLGDRFVDVQPVEYADNVPDDKKSPFIHDGETINGSKTADLNSLISSGQPLVEKLNGVADHLNHMVTKLDVDVFSNSSTEDLKSSIADLRQIISNVKDITSNNDLKETIAHLKGVAANADELLRQAREGRGIIGRAINDRRLADNLSDFLLNLKEHGPLFYSDTAAANRADKTQH